MIKATKTLLGIVTLCSLLTGLAQISSAQSKTLTLETLYGIEIKKDAVKVLVKSFGCTQPEHFLIKEQDDGALSIFRIKADLCRKRGKIQAVTLPFDLAGKREMLRISNPFKAD